MVKTTAQVKLILKKVNDKQISKADAARTLKISRKTLYSLLKGRSVKKTKKDLISKRILCIVVANPSLGPVKISQLLKDKGINLSSRSIWQVLKSLDLGTIDLREDYSLNFTKPQQALDNSLPVHLRLLPEARKRMVEAHDPAKYSVSRKTFSKWNKRYQVATQNSLNIIESLSDDYRRGYLHPRGSSKDVEEAVLSLVSNHPEYSSHKLALMLGTISNHGAQKILERNNLSHYEMRKAYSVARGMEPTSAPTVGIFGRIKSVFETFTPNLAPAPPPKFVSILKAFLISSGFSFIIVFGTLLWINVISGGGSFGAGVGLTFATIALAAGSFFFIYSLKYYLTTAITLSFSNREKKGPVDTKNPGMNADLSSIRIKKYPYISVQIPFYNEKNVVERSIKAATSFNYPEYEVILCDDSTDATTDKIRDFQKSCLFKGESLKITRGEGWTLTEVEVRPGVTLKHLHRTTRTGYKGGALALALKLVDPRTEFVSIFDADFVPYPDSLNLFVKYFKVANPTSENFSQGNVAAVQGYQWHVLNKSENWVTKGVRSEYAGSYVVERSGAEIYKGLKQISGSVYMIRRDVLDKIGWGTSITEDFELTLKLYDAGYKVVYTPYIQAPAECVSTLRRMVRQRMRWAEGHSFNVKLMARKLLTNPKLSIPEKLEFTYLMPYYLQAFFFLVGTFCWLLSETVFKVRLPFWTQLWGWSLVLTNMVSLPLLNAVGMFLEESPTKDYTGLVSFVALSYIVVPFQAYAAVKGFLEKKEGPWFRTPKTGRITDVFKRNEFYRFIQGFMPGRNTEPVNGIARDFGAGQYLNLATANNRFDNFDIRKSKGRRWVGKLMLVTLLIISNTLLYFSGYIETFAPQPVHAEQNFGSLINPAANSGNTGITPPASTTNNFQNGVLAVNTDRQVYLPGETAIIQMAALSPKGDSICNAGLSVEVNGEKQTGVIKTGACVGNNVTNTPDYVLYYKTGTNGTYNIKVTNTTTGLTAQNSFTVDSSRTLDIVRKTATRINPFKADSYPVNLYVTSTNDYQGEITDQVPAGFKIINSGNAKVENGKITWQVNLKKGTTKEYQYTYQAPKISPELFLIGPTSKWQLASDGQTQTWTGGTNGNWMTAGNWASGAVPNPGDDLVFPSSVTTYSLTNDFPQYTMFDSITISGSGYTLGGNDIILGQGLAGITDSVSSGGNTINLNVRMDVTRWITVTNSSETLTFNGMITGLGGMTKKGQGKLILSGANTFAGTLKIDEGIVNAQNSRALGTIAAGTEVVGGAALELQGGVNIDREPLTLRGYGVSENGALRNISGVNTFAGLITLVGVAKIQSDADTLNLRGGVTGTIQLIFDGAGNISFYDAAIATSTGAVTKNGSGTVTYFYPNSYTGVTTINAGKLLYGVDNALFSGPITVNGGTLDISTYSDLVGTVTLGTLTGAAGIITGTTGMLSSGAFTVYAGTISAVIAGDGGTLTKSTPATVTLTRPNQFTGAVAVNAGVLKIQDSMALGTIDGATTVASGATLQIDGNGGSLSVPEYITLNGSGALFASALRNSNGNNTITGLITLASISYIEADLGTTLTVDTKGLSALTYALHIGGAGNITFTSTAPIYGTSATLTKNDTGTLTLSAFNNYTGVTTINSGTVVLNGLGAIPLSTTMAINSQATLTIDNSSSTSNIDRLADSLALTMNGGNFNFSGSSNTGIYETAGLLTFGSGNNVMTVTPGSGGSTVLRFASYARTVGGGASILFRGTNFGAAPASGVSTLLFTTAPALVGDDGVAGTPTVSILQGAYGDNSLVGTGTDMVTYGLGNLNGLRLLNSNEYTTDFTVTNANIKISASTAAVTSQINSLILNTGASVTDAGNAQTITFTSGNILNLQSSGTIAGANTTMTGAGGSVEFSVRTVNDLNISSAITTTGGLNKSGSGTLTFSLAGKTYTGLTSINEGTLLCGVTNAIPSVNVTVNNATLNIADRTDTVSAVILQSGTITGTTGTLTAASYDLRSGTVSAILAGSGTLQKTVTNAQSDATVTLTRDNTYTGLTAINAGVLKLGADDDGTESPLGTTANGTTIANVGALDLNGHYISIAEAITQLNGLGYGVGASVANGNSNMGAIMNSSPSSASYGGAITLLTASRINADFGAITVGTGAISGAYALTLGGYGNMTVSSPIGSVTGLTKDGLGILILSGNSTCASAFTISSGILKLGATGDGTNGPLGTAVGATTISSGAIFDLNGQTYQTAEPLTINGAGGVTGDFGDGALINSSGNAATFPGNITLGAASMIRADYGNIILSGTGGSGAQTLTLTGASTGSSLAGTTVSGAGTIVKLGSGTWNLSGNSTFTGATTIYEGTIQLGGPGSGTYGPLGTIGTGTTIISGGVLDLNGQTLVTAEPLTINGFGISAGGALYNNNSNPTGYSGAITPGTDVRINNYGAGLLTLTGGIPFSTNTFTLYLGGTGNTTLSTVAISGSGNVVKDGAGTVTMNFSETYTGTTTINAGTFAYGTGNGYLAASNVSVNAGVWDMGGNTDTVGTVTLVGGTIQNGSLTGTAYTFENGTISAVLAGAIAVTKNTNGVVTWTGVNTNTGATTVNQGTLVISGSGKSATSGVTINVGATFNLDNSTTSVTTRLNNGTPPAITMNGGNFNYIGSNTTSTTAAETDGALNITTGYNIVTITPGTGGPTTMTFASLSRSAGAEVLFRGTSLGATPAASVSTLVFTAAPTLIGGGGNSGTNTVSIIKGAFGDGSLTGTGTDMVTYKPPTDTSTSLRLLTAGEYASSLTANANVKLTAPTAATATNTNSLILNGGEITNASVTIPIAAAALSGNILIGTANNIAGANTVLGITTYELCILANASSTISAVIGTATTGSLTLGGTGTLSLNAANLYTGTTYINNATLTYLTNNAISSGGVTIVDGTYNLNGSSDTVGAISLNAGTVQTGSGTLTSTSVTTVANNYISSTISGNLALGAGQTFTVNDGLVDNDLIVSAVISGGTLTKANTGTLVLSGNNTYTGVTTISSSGGTIRLGSAGGGLTYGPLGTTDAGTIVGTSDTLDLNGYNLGTAEGLTISSTGVNNNGAIANTSSTTATYIGQITLGAAVSIYANFGDIDLTSTSTVTGPYTLTLQGNGNGIFAGTLASGAGAITKNGLGTWTVSGNSAYTGATTISAGVFRLGSAGSGGNTPLGTTVGATTVSSTGVLDLNNYTLNTSEPITINGTGIANCGAIYSNSSSSITYSGAITLGSTAPRIVNLGSGSLIFTGNISGNYALTTATAPGSITLGPGVWSGSGTLTKEGWGTTILTGLNTMTGAIGVTTGYLQVGVSGDGTNTALGTYLGGVTVSAGAVLDLSTYNLNGGTTYEPITLNGSGIKNGGALISSSSSGSNLGALTLSSACRIINSGSGVINVTGAVSTASNLIVGGTGPTTISGNLNTAGITVTKFDGGTLILSGATNVNTGLIRINGGILQYGTSDAIHSGPVTIAGGTLDVNGQTDTVGVVTLISGTLTDTSGSPGVLTIATNSIFESGTVSEALAGTTLAIAKNTGGTVTFSNNGTVINTYTGTTSINAGTLQYLASNIMADASLINVTGGILDVGAYPDTIASLTLTSGTVKGSGGILTGTASPAYAVQSGTIGAILAGAVNLTKTTAGTVTLSGVNTYTGITTITLGMLSVGTIGNGSAGGSNLGNASNLAANLVFTAGTLQYTGGSSSTDRSSSLTAVTVDVTNPSAVLTMTGATNVAAGALTKAGSGTLNLSAAQGHTGTTTVLAGTLQYGIDNALSTGAVTVTNGIYDINNHADSVGAVTLTNDGQIIDSFGTNGVLTSTTTFALQSGTVSAKLAESSAASAISKTTSGRVILSGSNSFTNASPTITVTTGVLNVQNSMAFGGAAPTVASLAALEIQSVSGITIPSTKTITISGGGINNQGAINNISGSNVIQATVALGATNTRINSGGGSLTLSAASSITATAYNLIVGGNGPGNVTISGIIAITSGTLTKDGAGTLTLSGTNTYTGVTTVSSGTIIVGTNAPSGSNGAFGNATSEVVLGTAGGNNNASILTGGAFTVGRIIRVPTTDVTDTGTRTIVIGGNTADNSTFSGVVYLGTTNFAGESVALSAVSGGKVTFSGVIQNPSGMDGTTYSVTTSGGGTIVYGVANTYTGSTNVSSGTLKMGIANGFLSGTVAVSSGGTLDTAGYNLTSAGSSSFTNSGTIRLMDNETITNAPINNPGSLVQYYGNSGPYSIKNWTYSNIQFSSSVPTTYTPPSSLICNNLTIDSGNTFNAVGATTVDINGTITNNGTLTAPSSTGASAFTLGGDFVNNGTFNSSNGRMTLDGNGGAGSQTLSGSTTTTTFYQLYITAGAARTVYFKDGNTYSIADGGTVSFQGTAVNQLTLTSLSSTAQWYLSVSNTGTTINVNYVTVSWSNASTRTMDVSSSTGNSDGGNNTKWIFVLAFASVASSATGYSFQRKTFYDSTNNIYWQFAYDGTQIVSAYNTIPDSNSWTTSTPVSINTNDFSLWNDNNYVYMAYATNNDIMVMQGTLAPSSITWGAPYVAFNGTGSSDRYGYTYITTDSNNQLWVTSTYYSGANYYIKAVQSINADDPSVWNTASTLSDATNTSPNNYATINSLGNGNMYAVWIRGTTIEGSLYSSGTWASVPDLIAAGSTGMNNNFSISSDTNNNLYLSYIDGTGLVQFQEYTTSWSGATQVSSGSTTNAYTSISVDTNNNNVYVLYIRTSSTAGTIYYNKYSGGSWAGETSTGWKVDSTNTNLTTNFADSGKIYGEWTSGSGSPYTISWTDIIVPENTYLMIGFIPLVSYFIKRKKKTLAQEERKC